MFTLDIKILEFLILHIYGTPQPADGILSPNDEIILNWSETIDENRFYSQETNISMKAVKNESEISHDAYLFLILYQMLKFHMDLI